jgi:hypothetical protein
VIPPILPWLQRLEMAPSNTLSLRQHPPVFRGRLCFVFQAWAGGCVLGFRFWLWGLYFAFQLWAGGCVEVVLASGDPSSRLRSKVCELTHELWASRRRGRVSNRFAGRVPCLSFPRGLSDATGADLLEDSSHSTQNSQPLLPFVRFKRLRFALVSCRRREAALNVAGLLYR